MQIRKRGECLLPESLAKEPGRRLRHMLIAHDRQLRRRLLEDVVLVNNDNFGGFWGRWKTLYENFITNSELLTLRNEVRQAWQSDPTTFFEIVTGWLSKHQVSSTGWHAPIWSIDRDLRLIEPNIGHLKASLAFAMVENWPKLGYCQNGECTSPYFLKVRARDRCCPNCSDEAVRITKREWHDRHRRKTSQKRRSKAN